MTGNALFLNQKSKHLQHSNLFFIFCLLLSLPCYAGTADPQKEKTEKKPAWSFFQFLEGNANVPSEVKSFTPVTITTSRLPNGKTRFFNTPANISYKSEKALDKTHPRTFQDSVKDLEGVVLNDSVGNGIDTNFSLRGFTNSSDVIFLLDGVRINELDGNAIQFPLISMSDIESIQIDRGSASPVYGSGAFAGVVHLTTGQPSEKPLKLFGGLEWSSFRGLRFNQGLSGTLQDKWTGLGGKFKYYFNGGRDVNHGFRENGDWRITSFDIKTAYVLPDELVKLYFNLKHVHDALSNPGELTFQQFQDNPNRSNKIADGREMDETIVQLGADAKFWDEKITASIMADWRLTNEDLFLTSGTFIDFTTGSDPNTDRLTIKNRVSDLIWQLAYEDEWKWLHNQSLIGMEIRRGGQTDASLDAFKGIVNWDAPTQTDRKSNPSNVSLFWRETLTLFGGIIPYVGMRYDKYSLRTEDELDRTSDISSRWSNASWSTGLTVKPVKWVDIFGNYSQGFRVPTISELAPFTSGINRELQPEKTDSYEVGTRLRYKDKGLAKFSFFVIDQSDEIVFDSTSKTEDTPYGRNINIGKTRRTGIETSVNARPIDEVELYGTYTWTLAFVQETDGGGSIIDGRTIGQVPENRFTLGANVRPLKRLGEPFDGLRVGMNGTFTGRQHPTSFESADQSTLDATGGAGHYIKAYSIWDFILSYNWRGKEIYFKINNMFDEKYYSRAISATSFGSSIYPFGTYTFVDPGAPREFVVGTKWEFQ